MRVSRPPLRLSALVLSSLSLLVPLGAGVAPSAAASPELPPYRDMTETFAPAGPGERDGALLPDPLGPRPAVDLPSENRRTQRPSLAPPLTAPIPGGTHGRDGVGVPPRLRSPRERAQECRASDFVGLTGTALTTKITASTSQCMNTLFFVQGQDSASLFREAQMITVADELRRRAAAYDGQGEAGVAQLVLYLRAGYYVQYGQPKIVGSYSDALSAKVRSALDTFFANPQAWQVSEANGKALSEAVTLIDSAQLNAHYLPVIKRLHASYDNGYRQHRSMMLALNNTYTVFFRGHQLPSFVQAVASDPGVLTMLRDFALKHIDLLSGDDHFLTTNAGRELARFLGDPAVKPLVKPLVIDILSKTSVTGKTAPLYVGVAAMAQDLDPTACAAYRTCDLKQKLRKTILPTTLNCSPSIRFVAQTPNPSDLDESCRSLKGQDSFFHQVVRDRGPVAKDHNSTLEVNVFHSPKDYQWYANAIFGITTDNGGMYLEGNPEQPNNQARFIAYHEPTLKPGYQIWNLNHEYTHYLDGRFNMFGNFHDNVRTPTIWWIEGIAEYVSYSYRKVDYEAAIAVAARPTYRLSTLFDTTYHHDTTRVYRWGYLATRFMLEEHPGEIDRVLEYYRQGDWENARYFLTRSIGTAYDDEFADWLKRCSEGACRTASPALAPTG